MENIFQTLLEWTLHFVDVLLHLDVHLAAFSAEYGVLLYGILFLVIFCETGLVVLPFLPGDSLLFATGALIAIDGSDLNLFIMWPLLIMAGVLGDAVNYSIGHRVGPKIFRSEGSRLLNKEHLLKAQNFYEKYGGVTIIIARFVPILRTFAPFVAGIGRMTYSRFASYNFIGAMLWVSSFLSAGYLFGNIPLVKRNFTLVIFVIILISVLPMFMTWLKARRESKLKTV